VGWSPAHLPGRSKGSGTKVRESMNLRLAAVSGTVRRGGATVLVGCPAFKAAVGCVHHVPGGFDSPAPPFYMNWIYERCAVLA